MRKDSRSNKEKNLALDESPERAAVLKKLNHDYEECDSPFDTYDDDIDSKKNDNNNDNDNGNYSNNNNDNYNNNNNGTSTPPSPNLPSAVNVKVVQRQSSHLNWNIKNSYNSPNDAKKCKSGIHTNNNIDNGNSTNSVLLSSQKNNENDGKKSIENESKGNTDDDIKIKRTSSFLHLISGAKNKSNNGTANLSSPKISGKPGTGTGSGIFNSIGIFKRKNRSFGVMDSGKAKIAADVTASVNDMETERRRGNESGDRGPLVERERESEWNKSPKMRSGSYSVESSVADSLRAMNLNVISSGSGSSVSAYKPVNQNEAGKNNERGKDIEDVSSRTIRSPSKPEDLSPLSANAGHTAGPQTGSTDRDLSLHKFFPSVPQSPVTNTIPPSNTNPKHLDLLVTPKGWKLGDKLILNARSFTLNTTLYTSSSESHLASLIRTPHLLIAALLKKAFHLSNIINGEPPTKSTVPHTKCANPNHQNTVNERIRVQGSDEITSVTGPIPVSTPFRGLENSSVLLRSPKTVVDDFIYGVSNSRQREKERDRESEKDRDRDRDRDRESQRDRGMERDSGITGAGVVTGIENGSSLHQHHTNIINNSSFEEEYEEGEDVTENNNNSDSDSNNQANNSHMNSNNNNSISHSNNSNNNDNNNNNEDIHNDYMSDETQVLWIELMDGVSLLQSCSADGIDPESDQALCMFLNLYHLMVIHSSLVMGPPCSAYKVSYVLSALNFMILTIFLNL